ncbi:hypothetical protein AYO45_02915 [Gammaproteobacteria bacterium SCGC AG-212-F23]|nr:hypothetical protein AYO45_02915 [Gammaproteobacteria bacterium SCGC AG-212-F23]
MNSTNQPAQGMMNPNDFSLSVMIKEAWARSHGFKLTWWKAAGLYILVAIALGLLLVFIDSLAQYFFGDTTATTVVSSILNFIRTVVLYPMAIGLFLLGLKRVTDQPIDVKMVFACYSSFWRITGVFILTTLILGVGFFFASLFMGLAESGEYSILPDIVLSLLGLIATIASVYLMVAYSFAALVTYQKGTGVWASMEISRKAITKHWFKTFFTFIVVLLLVVASCIPVFVGLVWSLPWASCVWGILYKKLIA